MKGCLEHTNSRWDTDYFFSMDKKDFDELVKKWEIESSLYSDWFDTKKQLFITLHADLKYWEESITQDLDTVSMKFSYKLLGILMNYDRDTFEHRYNLRWDKFIFFIRDSYQKLCLDYNLKTAEEKSSK
jgi:hypothetical protein